jgi:Uma2 family endonuclease
METSTDLGDPPLVLQLQPTLQLSDEQFFELAQLNRDLRMERTARGELILALPTGGKTGERNSEITMQLALWAKRDGRGITFDSSTGFKLPNGAVRSPDASWVAKARLAELSDEQKQKFPPLCPDFVIELRSPTDRLSVLREKMQEYLDNGAQLGLLLDPEQRRVYVYRAGAEVEELTGPETVSAEPVLPGFALDLREIW